MLTPATQAMVSGMQQGQQQASSILPSAFQPQGRAQPTNPWQGVLDSVNNQLLQVAYGVGQQGQAFREFQARLLKLAYETTKLSNELTETAAEGQSAQLPMSR